MKSESKNYPCIQCDLEGSTWKLDCHGCIARKIILLRSPDAKTSRRMQLEILNALSPKEKDDVLLMVAEYDEIYARE